jgi:hypothetical protein
LHVTNVTVGANDTTVAIQIDINAAQTRMLHFSQGTDTASVVFMGFGSYAARLSLQQGTRVVLIAPPNQIASIYSIA